jgi:hypothetical protein
VARLLLDGDRHLVLGALQTLSSLCSNLENDDVLKARAVAPPCPRALTALFCWPGGRHGAAVATGGPAAARR